MPDPLASLPTDPACYGTSDIARLRDTADRYARTAADLLRQRNDAAAALERMQNANDTLALTLAEAIGTLAPDGGGCSRVWIPASTVDRWRRALNEAEEARRG